VEARPLTEKELVDWERWSRREITWKGSDVARLIATIRELQRQLANTSESGDDAA
jgi:hypothetical protein